MSESTSDIAYFRQQQVLAEEAARLGLYGFAEVARHERITARMERGGQLILGLMRQGRHKEALALMNTENWGVDEAERIKGQIQEESGEMQ